MHPYKRLPSSGHSTPPSPPSSPLRSPRLRHGRSKAGRFSPAQPPTQTVAQRLTWVFLSVLLRRQCVFLFAPLIYISGMLLYMGTVSFDVVPIIKHRPSPGSIYRSPELYTKLRHEMDADDSFGDAFWYRGLGLLGGPDGYDISLVSGWRSKNALCLCVCFLFCTIFMGIYNEDSGRPLAISRNGSFKAKIGRIFAIFLV